MKSQMAGLLSIARHLRETLDPLPPIAMWHPIGGEGGGMAWLDVDDDDLAAAADELRSQIGPVVWFAVVFDTYARDGDPTTDQGLLGIGVLDAAFRDGDPSVMEQIVLVMWTGEDPQPEMAWQVYRWTPVDGWEWDQPRLVADPSEVASSVRWV